LLDGSLSGVPFDLAKSIPDRESMRHVLRSSSQTSDQLEYAVEVEMKELEKYRGALGAFKLESEAGSYREYVGLAPKMYSLDKVERCGKNVVESKGKGVPKHVMNTMITQEDFRRTLFDPLAARKEAKFRRFQSFSHKICNVETTRKLLTSVQDKTYQLDPLTSRPLGHWRNRALDDDDGAAMVVDNDDVASDNDMEIDS
jgi:hypothetical protein